MDGSPGASAAVASAVEPTGTYSGYVFSVRLNGQVYVDLAQGYAILPPPGVPLEIGRPMTSDTDFYLWSCAKSVCHAALLAMIEDWTALSAGVRAGPGAPSTPVTFQRAGQTIAAQVPNWMMPAFSDPTTARQFLTIAQPSISFDLQTIVRGFADGALTLVQPARQPQQPGFIGLLSRAGSVPTNETPFMSLIGKKLKDVADALVPPLPQPYPFGEPPPPQHGGSAHGVGVPFPYSLGTPATFTLKQLITHETTLHLDTLSPNIVSEIPSAAYVQVAGEPASFDVWPYVVGITLDTWNPESGYNNNDYTVLGAVIAACTGMYYDDYVAARLCVDPRFSTIRSSPPGSSPTVYYETAPDFGPGVLPCSYVHNANGAGSLFASASQFTDWMWAVYACDSTVAGWSGTPAPVLSQADSMALFSNLGAVLPSNWDWVETPNAQNGWTILGKFGWSGWQSSTGRWGYGSTNTAIAISPDGSDVMTACFATNCNMQAPAINGLTAGFLAAIEYYIANP